MQIFDAHNTHSAKAFFSSCTHVSTAIIQSNRMCVVTGKSLKGVSCACNFPNSSSFPQNKARKRSQILAKKDAKLSIFGWNNHTHTNVWRNWLTSRERRKTSSSERTAIMFITMLIFSPTFHYKQMMFGALINIIELNPA